ncbi:MAG: EAL domain-containing protein [Thomasclavelia sp.]|nr:EAL domain-containing protein [Thomasclavelia sp.]
MLYNFSFDIAAIIFEAILYVYFNMKIKKMENLRVKIFGFFIVFLFITGVFDIITCFMSTGTNHILLSHVTNVIFLLCESISPVLYVVYAYLIAKKNQPFDTAFWLLCIPAFICCVMVLVSPGTGLMYYLNDKGAYFHGSLHFILYISGAFYAISALTIMYLSERKKRKSNTIFTLIACLVIFTAMIIQNIYPKQLLIVFSSVIVMWMMFINYELVNEDYDRLTKIYNRHAFDGEVRRLLRVHPNTEYAIIVLNINVFKIYNELFGTKVGDSILCVVANYLENKIGDKGIVARYESDNFAVCMESKDLEIISLPSSYDDNKIYIETLNHNISFTLGIYKTKGNSQTPIPVMVDYAIIALKNVRMDSLVPYGIYNYEMSKNTLATKRLIVDFDESLNNDQFTYAIQPIYNNSGTKIEYGEVLVRWNHPFYGMLDSSVFINSLEDNNLISKMDWYVWNKACDCIKKLNDEGINVPLTVNVSRGHLYDIDFHHKLNELLTKKGISKNQIVLEITENDSCAENWELMDVYQKLREDGYKIMMDDFGSGYSSLNMLKDVDVDIIKIDLLFLSNVQNSKTKIIFENILNMIHELGFKSVVEGVETREQYSLIKELDNEFIQGYFFSKPVSATEFIQLVKKENK